MKFRLLTLIILTSLITPSGVKAATLILTDGRQIEADAIEYGDDEIIVQIQGSRLTYFPEQIESIDGSSLKAILASANTDLSPKPVSTKHPSEDGIKKTPPQKVITTQYKEDLFNAGDLKKKEVSLPVIIQITSLTEEEKQELETFYMDYRNAFAQAQSFSEIKDFLSAEQYRQTQKTLQSSPLEESQLIAMAKMMAPANPTIVDIKVERGNAVIYATGMGMTGEGEGQIEFIRTNTNEWKLLNEAWNFK